MRSESQHESTKGLPGSEPFDCPEFRDKESDRILEFLVRKIILALEIDMLPGDDGAVAHRDEECLPAVLVVGFRQLFREIEIIPANDGVFDQAAAPFGDFLLDFFPRQELLVIAKRHGARKLIGVFAFVELLFHRLTQGDGVNVPQEEV